MLYPQLLRGLGGVALLFYPLFAACGGGGTNDGGDDDTGGTGAARGDGGTGGSDDGTGGAQASACAGPVIDLADFAGTVDAATPIAAGEQWGFIRGLEGQGEDLYVLTGDALYLVQGDSTDRTVVSDQIPALSSSYLAAGRGRIRLDETHAYIATDAGISRVALSDGSVEELYDGSADDVVVYALQLSGGLLYFGISGDFIYSLPLAGGEEPTLVSDEIDNSAFWVDGDYVYGPAEYDYMSRVPLAGGEVERVTGHAEGIQPFVNQTQVDDGKMYWNDSGVFLSCPIGACTEPESHRASHSDYFLVLGDIVYGTNGSLGWSSLVSEDCQLLVSQETPYEVSGFGVTDNYIYFHGSFEAGLGSSGLLRLPL